MAIICHSSMDIVKATKQFYNLSKMAFYKTASVELQKQIDRAFSSANLYPPFMKTIVPSKKYSSADAIWAGEIDHGIYLLTKIDDQGMDFEWIYLTMDIDDVKANATDRDYQPKGIRANDINDAPKEYEKLIPKVKSPDAQNKPKSDDYRDDSYVKEYYQRNKDSHIPFFPIYAPNVGIMLMFSPFNVITSTELHSCKTAEELINLLNKNLGGGLLNNVMEIKIKDEWARKQVPNKLSVSHLAISFCFKTPVPKRPDADNISIYFAGMEPIISDKDIENAKSEDDLLEIGVPLAQLTMLINSGSDIKAIKMYLLDT